MLVLMLPTMPLMCWEPQLYTGMVTGMDENPATIEDMQVHSLLSAALFKTVLIDTRQLQRAEANIRSATH
jgi:hypothetical protein